MLDKKGTRQLCYVVYIDAIEPIVGSDNCEAALVGGWKVMVKKNTFDAGDPAIYFEIDSRVDTTKPEFAFLEKKHGAVKTQKYTFGGKNPGFYSQGLLMAASDFGWKIEYAQFAGDFGFIVDDENKQHIPGDESAFLTEKLGVTYYEPEDNKRKANSNPDAKINAALARHPKIAKKFGKFIKKHKFTRKLFLFFFGRKSDTPRSWPQEVKKTDEERIENLSWILNDYKKLWVATEKIDGSSATYHLRRGKDSKKNPNYFVCSRNVVFNTPEADKKNYYKDTIGNIWIEINEKYDMRSKLEQLLTENPEAEWVTVQGEIFGAGVQKRDYGMKDHDIRAFNLIYSNRGRVGTLEMKEILEKIGIPTVPVISEGMNLPGTIEELRAFVHSETSAIDGGMKEGIVFRSLDGVDSFKCVDPEFLIKYHG